MKNQKILSIDKEQYKHYLLEEVAILRKEIATLQKENAQLQQLLDNLRTQYNKIIASGINLKLAED